MPGMKTPSSLLLLLTLLSPSMLHAHEFKHTGLEFRGIKLGMDRPDLLEEIRASGWISRGKADDRQAILVLCFRPHRAKDARGGGKNHIDELG
jgi:hypothetical protein